MKSHEFAQALSALARLLRAAPDLDLAELKITDSSEALSTRDLALNLSTLVSLSSVSRQKWLELIHENGFPIEVRPRDASRDIFGKLCAYLEKNPVAQERLKASANRPSGKSSPELMRALATLLKDQRTDHQRTDLRDLIHEPSSE